MATQPHRQWKESGEALLTNTKTTIQAYPTELVGWVLHNTTAMGVWIQLFDKLAADVTVGTTAANRRLFLPASQSLVLKPSSDTERGFNHSIGLVVAATTTATGSTAPGSAIYANFLIK